MSEQQSPSVLSPLGARLGRDTSIYGIGSATGLFLSLVNVAVLTRFLEPRVFGQLALLLVFAALLTVVYNLGSLQGAFTFVFGSSGEEDVSEFEGGEVAADKRRALGTAFVLTALVAIVGTVIAGVFSPALARVLIGDRGEGDLVLLAAASGALGALWRLVSNIPRLERRPVVFVVLSNLRPVLVLAVALPLVTEGHGIAGVLIGTGAGTAAATAIGLLLVRSSFAIAFGTSDAARIYQSGAFFVPVVVAFWVIQNVDLYVLSVFASDHDVGLYRVASRMGSAASYFVSAFAMAWAPIPRTSMFMAAERKRGLPAIGSLATTYFLLASLGLLLALSVAAEEVVNLAGPGYGGAAPLIPLLALGFLAYGTFVVIYRVVRFPGRRQTYLWMSLFAALLFLGLVFILTPLLGAYGAALSPVLAFAVPTGVLVHLSQRGPTPTPFDWTHIGAATSVAIACLLTAYTLGPAAGPARPMVAILAIAAYPVTLVATGIVPRRHAAALRGIAQELMLGSRDSPELRDRMQRLPDEQTALLEMLVRERLAAREVAELLNTSQTDIHRRAVAALRPLFGRPAATHGDLGSRDEELGRYLFSTAPIAEKDAMVRLLWRAGLEPVEIDQFERGLDKLRRAPASMWGSRGIPSKG